MSAPVDVLSGIGKVTKADLSRFGIHTVHDLARADPVDVPITKITKFISAAKEFIKEDEKKNPSSHAQVVPKEVLGGVVKTKDKTKDKTNSPRTSETESPRSKKIELTEEEIFISDHTWWENRIILPAEDGGDMREAIIYEMSITPHNRISFLCSWIRKDKKKLCSMTYSPQFISIFNLSLPPLAVSVNPSSLDKIRNRAVLENVLWETNLILHQIRKPEESNVMDLLKL